MIIFYTAKQPIIEFKSDSICDSICNSTCIKPKNRCCNKYKKKGINCKRCPNILLKAAS